jgi:3-oxoacyl-[acyl-carrier-protein] synthase II
MTGQLRRDPDWPAAPRRVVVTGMGMLTALGNDVPSTWAGMVAGRSGVAEITLFDPSRLGCRIAGEVKDFDASGVLDKKDMRRFDRYIQLGLVAARQAMDQAGLPARLEGREAERTGVIFGTGLGGVGTLVDGITINALRGPDRISPFFIPMGIPNVGAGQIAISFGMTGPNFTTVSACATGGHAIGEAFETIRRGDADVMVAGGTESPICRIAVAGFAACRALSTGFNDRPTAASRPYDRDRDGFVMGEGAGVVVLETLEHAKARGAKIYAEVIGYGMSGDAYHITAPAENGDGAYRCMRAALKRAEIDVSDIDYVNAHGTSTPMGDEIELGAVERLFGNASGKLAMSSTKSATGHLLGAAGAIEAIFSALAIRDNIAPPTLNLDNPSVETAIDLVPHTAKKREINTVLSNSFGFGGTNASLILRRVA